MKLTSMRQDPPFSAPERFAHNNTCSEHDPAAEVQAMQQYVMDTFVGECAFLYANPTWYKPNGEEVTTYHFEDYRVKEIYNANEQRVDYEVLPRLADGELTPWYHISSDGEHGELLTMQGQDDVDMGDGKFSVVSYTPEKTANYKQVNYN